MYGLPNLFDSICQPLITTSAISDGHDGIVLEQDIGQTQPIPMLSVVMPGLSDCA
jgi:hypothetical protein